MSDLVDLVIEDHRWETIDIAALADRAVGAALDVAGIAARPVEISLLACGDAEIATLNSAYRGKSSATNVLSWPAQDLFADRPGGPPRADLHPDPFGVIPLGDIAIAYETVMEEARSAGIPAEDHVLHLILHGCLHLLGYDHVVDADAELMEALEIRALAGLGVASPYA